MNNVPSISSGEFLSLLDAGRVNILDVREPEEIVISSISGSLNIPMMELESNLDLIRREVGESELPLVVLCRSGARSAMVTSFLRECGFLNVHNLDAGIVGLSKIRISIIAY